MRKLKDYAQVLYSGRGNIQMAVLYDPIKNKDIADSTVDYLIENYGDKYDVVRIEAYGSDLAISVVKAKEPDTIDEYMKDNFTMNLDRDFLEKCFEVAGVKPTEDNLQKFIDNNFFDDLMCSLEEEVASIFVSEIEEVFPDE